MKAKQCEFVPEMTEVDWKNKSKMDFLAKLITPTTCKRIKSVCIKLFLLFCKQQDTTKFALLWRFCCTTLFSTLSSSLISSHSILSLVRARQTYANETLVER